MTTVFAILTGVLFGVIAGALFLALAIKKKIWKSVDVSFPHDMDEDKRDELQRIAEADKKAYKKSCRGNVLRRVFGIGRGTKKAWVNYGELIKKTAATCNPDSPAPLLELSERQLFGFLHIALNKLRTMLDSTGIKLLESVSVSTVYTSAGLVGNVVNNKAVKRAQKVFTAVFAAINLINPFFWIKRIMTAAVYETIIRQVAYSSIDVTVTEFTRLYLDCTGV